MKKRKKDPLLEKNISNNSGHYFAVIVFERDGVKYKGRGQGGHPDVAYGRAKRAGVALMV